MKHLTTYINEDAIRYELPADYQQKAENILTEFVNDLPEAPFINHSKTRGGSSRGDGIFWFNKYDLVRSPRAESAEYIGYSQEIHNYMDSKNNDYDVDVVKRAFNVIFGANINEGVFDNNIKKDIPEYEWVFKLHESLCEYFKVNKLNNVLFEHSWRSTAYPAGIFKKTLLNQPTIEKDGLYVTLNNIEIDLRKDYEFSKIIIKVFVYEKKDAEKLAAIKSANDTRKPLDIMGRELMVGDTVAYALIGGYNSYKGLMVGKVTKVMKDQVEMGSKKVYADRCCLISRKDGKMIE